MIRIEIIYVGLALICIGVLSNILNISFILLALGIYIVTGIYICYCINIHSTNEYTKYPLKKTSKIPNVIYTYWNTPIIPFTVQACINSWKKYNPSYTIHIINEKTLHKYCPELVNITTITQQRLSDFIRLYLLQKYGGFWLDSCIYLNQSLDWVHGYQHAEQSEFVGYKLQSFMTTKTPVIESWFLASIPKSYFITNWKNEFFKLNTFSTVTEYVDQLRKTVDFQNIDDPYYLTIHVSCLSVLKSNKYSLSILTAENGPFLSLSNSFWNPIYLPLLLLFYKGKEAPLIKYRGGERYIIEYLNLYTLL